MARKTDRNFLADFASLDIEYLPEKGPEVSRDIQMVYVMGDVSAAPVAAVPVFGTGLQQLPVPEDQAVTACVQQTSGAGGLFTACELLVDAGIQGCWVTPVFAGTESEFSIFTRDVTMGLALTITPTVANSAIFGVGTLPASTVGFGTTAVVAPAQSWVARGGNRNWNILYKDAFFVGPGRFVVVETTLQNVTKVVGMLWREIA